MCRPRHTRRPFHLPIAAVAPCGVTYFERADLASIIAILWLFQRHAHLAPVALTRVMALKAHAVFIDVAVDNTF